jgi:hypothetical protein
MIELASKMGELHDDEVDWLDGGERDDDVQDPLVDVVLRRRRTVGLDPERPCPPSREGVVAAEAEPPRRHLGVEGVPGRRVVRLQDGPHH